MRQILIFHHEGGKKVKGIKTAVEHWREGQEIKRLDKDRMNILLFLNYFSRSFMSFKKNMCVFLLAKFAPAMHAEKIEKMPRLSLQISSRFRSFVPRHTLSHALAAQFKSKF